MPNNITLQDLNAVRQLMQVFRALEKFEPLIKNVLQADEEIGDAKRQTAAALKELQGVKDEIEKSRESHREEMRKFNAQKTEARKQVETDLKAARARLQTEFNNQVSKDRTAAEQELADLREAIGKESRNKEQLAEQVKGMQRDSVALQQERTNLEGLIADLTSSREKLKAELSEMFQRLRA
jgi:chromosome segregation ATPase